MNKQRLQQLAGIKPLFEQNLDPKELFMQWEDDMAEEFIEKNPQVTDDADELEIETDGSVYHRESNQRWPEGTVTSWDEYNADKRGGAIDAAKDRMGDRGAAGTEQQEQVIGTEAERKRWSAIEEMVRFAEHKGLVYDHGHIRHGGVHSHEFRIDGQNFHIILDEGDR